MSVKTGSQFREKVLPVICASCVSRTHKLIFLYAEGLLCYLCVCECVCVCAH
jgi:hypothetical protein